MKQFTKILIICAAIFCSTFAKAGSFTVSGSTITMDLNVASQIVTVVSTGTTYTFTLSGGATNTWTGTTSANVTVSGATLTITSAGRTAFSTINITDSQTGTGVVFATSGANAYTDDFNITLDNTPGAVTFNGSSSFTGSSAINITTSKYVYFSALSSLKTANGNITLDANTQATPNIFSNSGITVDSSTVEITGSGILTMSARGGTGTSTSYGNNGIAVIKGGIVKGGTTGTTSITGWGYTGFAGTASNTFACGVMVVGTSTTAPPTITSNGSNVSITGYGAISTAAPATATTVLGHVGVSVGTPQYTSGTSGGGSTFINYSGLITSGGSGTVTINGYGGKSASQTVAPGYNSSCMGVVVFGSSCTITSGGAGKVTITGTGAGPDTLSEANAGVAVTGNITSGTNADLEVIGYQGISKSTNADKQFGHGGVYVYGSSAFIRAGVGTGNTRVVGTGAANTAGANSLRANGVYLHYGGTISSLGSGNVTVIGYGGGTELGSATSNKGVLLSGTNVGITSSISSNGGNVRVEGTGGGYSIGVNSSISTYNVGVELAINGSITAGGMGSVTVIGNGGNNNGNSGNENYGVNITSYGSGQAESYITSNGGDITVTGTGGGGNASSAAASVSSKNYGVYVNVGGYIVAGGLGNVTINGTGGNTSPGTTGANNYGVYVLKYSFKVNNVSIYNNRITTSGGNLIVNGTGGGNGGTSGNHYGVANEGLMSATGSGTVTITGQGGGGITTSGSGGGCHGVYVTGATLVNSVVYPATITSDGGNVTVTGTGGGSGTGSVNIGVQVISGGLITAGANGAVSVTGTGGNTAGVQNQGVYVNTISNSIPATITSGGGSVTVIGTGKGTGTSNQSYGVQLGLGGIITAGGNGAVSVTGTGSNSNGTSNYGVYVNGGTSPNFSTITSGGGHITVTGTGSQATAGTYQYGVYVAAGVIKSGGNGNVTVTGNGGTGDVGTSGNGHIGVFVWGVNALISSGGSGTVTVTGNGGGNGARAGNYGVIVSTTARISSGGAGTVTVNGNGGTVATGANQYGVYVSNSIITSGGGDIVINATEGGSATSYASYIENSGSITTATNGGDITINGNSIKLGNSAITTTAADNLTIIPLTNNTEVQFTSATDEKGKIYLSSTELGLITAGNINIGNANTGVISISEAVTAPTGSNLKLTNAAGISPKLNGTEITMATGKTLDITGVPSINIAISGTTVNTQYDQLKVVADLNITGKTLSLSGTYTPVGGNVFTIVDATSITGTFTGLANGAIITFNGRSLQIAYTATTVTLTDLGPYVTTNPTNQTATAGHTATFTAAATAATITPTVQWQVSTNGGTSYTDISGANNATYSFTAAGADNGNKYKAVFTNSYGSATSTAATLTVNVTPVITAQPSNTTVVEGNTASFTATASGTPAPTVKWQVNTGAGWSDIGGATSTTYSFTTALSDNGNQYQAVFTNIAGSVNSSAATLTVSSACTPTTSSDNIAICPNQLPYSWNGLTFNAAGSQTKTGLTNAGGCDSSATLNLTVNTTTTSTTNVGICPSQLPYSWNGLTFTTAGTQTKTGLTNAAGCDSSATLNLTVTTTTTSTTNVSICPSALPYSWNGLTFNAAGTQTKTGLTNAAGCDSSATLNLTVTTTTTSTTNVSICPSELPYSWNGLTFNAAGSQTKTGFTSAGGCDSTATLVLSLKAISSSSNSIAVTASQLPYSWNGLTFTAAGTQTAHLTNAAGCDSAASLTLSVNLPTTPVISGPTAVCAGATISLTANIPGGVWSTQQTSNASINSVTGLLKANYQGGIIVNYKVLVNGISKTASFNVTINAIPAVPTVSYTAASNATRSTFYINGKFCVGKSFTVVGIPNGGSWAYTNAAAGTISPAGLVSIIGVGSGSIVYTYTDANGCSNSRTMSGNTAVCPIAKGINTVDDQVSTKNDFTLYPNPAKGLINLNVEALVGAGSIIVTDLYGKTVKTQHLSMGTNTVDIANLSKGMYFVSTITNEGKTTKKLVVE